MATIHKVRGKKYAVRFRDHNGKTHELYGYLKKPTAMEHGAKLDRCIALLKRGDEMDPRLQDWLDELPDAIYSKLAGWGIVKARAYAGTLAELIEIFVTGEKSVGMKPNTIKNYRQVGNHLIQYFGATRPVNMISEKAAHEFYAEYTRKYLPGTWGKNIKTVKQFFRHAVKLEWIRKNPFEGLKGTNVTSTDRFFTVTTEMFSQVLDHCRNSQERLILVLGRYGGLRIPQELQFMEWGDFHVTEGFFVVKTPKKEKKANQDRGIFTDYATRRVPLFPEVEEAFQEYFEDFPAGGPRFLFSNSHLLPAQFRVIVTTQGLTSRLKKIVRQAGISLWPKPFQNLRSTRETELINYFGFPIQEVTKWLGNSPAVAVKHYIQTSPAIFRQAQTTRTDTHLKSVPQNVPLFLPPKMNFNNLNIHYTENGESDESPENTEDDQTFSRNENSLTISRKAEYYPLGRSTRRAPNIVKHETKRDTLPLCTTNCTTSEIKARILDLLLLLEPSERDALIIELQKIFIVDNI